MLPCLACLVLVESTVLLSTVLNAFTLPNRPIALQHLAPRASTIPNCHMIRECGLVPAQFSFGLAGEFLRGLKPLAMSVYEKWLFSSFFVLSAVLPR